MTLISVLNSPGKEELPLPSSTLPSLFKYFAAEHSGEHGRENLINLLKNGLLRATGQSEVNDPTDCNPVYLHNLSIKNYRQFIIKLIRQSPLETQQAKFQTQLKNQYPDELSIKKVKRAPKKYNRMVESVIQSNLNQLGFICFTEDGLSTLMWAHYASHHGGLCIEFETKSGGEFASIAEIPIGVSCIDVNYSDNRPIIKTNECLPNVNPDMLGLCITTKSKHWLYEKEWRYITRAGSQGKLHKPGDLVDIGTNAIKSICFGLKTTSETKSFVKRFLKDPQNKIKFFQIELAKNSFDLIRREI